ncbi:heavy metal-binding domain-containing protein [Streptomyces liangshanensis]|uniref:Heavy metal-binding domain-containing protein n=1 Tax=Streptomyces liangshanensis TaxID=2717324 RepID=A0A6G9GZG1_9ACTN|nr:heavy metal-binding domain-containing protein [Streptomyces liangshanensis]QIQ03456.1 heavy metal-binding domain-containing protein [Streptomyces liangshanensis]
MTVPWSGAGLPPAAELRITEAQRSGTWSSALSTSAFAAIRSVGFEPVGQAMGSTVYQVGRAGRFWGYYDCLYLGAGYTMSSAPGQVALSGDDAPSAGLVHVFDEARRTALGRLAAECTALGGDGVVAAEFTMAPFPSQPNCLEFKVIGTAVRARGEVRAPRPFTCHLDGQGFAKLVAAGWVPVELLVGMSIGVRHDDFGTRSQAFSWNNTEVGAWSELVGDVRADARHQLELQGTRAGGDGVVLASGDLRIWRESCVRASRYGTEAEDHVAESTMIGTTIARFRTRAERPPTLAVMPLGRRGERLRRRLAAMEASPYGDPAERRRLGAELEELGDQG